MRWISLHLLLLSLSYVFVYGDFSQEFTNGSQSVWYDENYISSLVHFLQSNSPFSNHLIVLTDDTTSPIFTTSAIKSSAKDGIGVTIIRYQEGLLKVFLKKRARLIKRLNILVATSKSNTYSIFEGVRNKSLESGNYRWFVLTLAPIGEAFRSLIRDGTEVIIVEGNLQNDSTLQIKASYWDVNSTLRFMKAGWFAPSASWLSLGKKFHYFPSNEEIYSNFQGRRIQVVTNNGILYFLQRKDKDGNLLPWEGIDVNVLNTVAEKHNFNYDLVHPKDGLWGGPERDGTISGLIGVVARHEAHLAIQELTITEERASVIDFTMPYYTEGSTIASKAPALKNQAKAVVSPFSFQVWVLLLVTMGIVGLTAKFMHSTGAKLSPRYVKELHRIKEKHAAFHLFNLFSVLVSQGSQIKTEILSMRVLTAVWVLICIVLTALYSGNLCAVFTAPSYFDPINSLSDLLEALKRANGRLNPICSKGTSIEYLFRDATYGTHHEIAKYFDPKKSFAGSDERYTKTAEGKAVVLTSMTSNVIKTYIFGGGRDKFFVGTENFYGQSYGIALSTGSPWQETFSKTLQRIVEAGLVDLWVKENIAKELVYIGAGRDIGNVLSRRSNENKPVTLTQLQAAYFILVVGLSLAFFAFVYELVYDKFWSPKRCEIHKVWK